MDSKLSTLLDRLQARDFYDAMLAIEKLGASEDLTAAVNAVGELMRKYGNHVRTREETEAAIVEAVEGLIGEDEAYYDPDDGDDADGYEVAEHRTKLKNQLRQAIKEWQ